jgi:hypothetical protein
MRRSLCLSIAAAAAAMSASPVLGQAFSIRNVQFSGGTVQTAQVTGDSIVVFGDDNTPLFRGSPSFALGFAGNQDGRVYEWDTVRQRVRISPPGQPGAWVACNDVAPMTIACSGVLRISSEGKLVLENRRVVAGGVRGSDEGPVDSAGVPPGAVPNCPGDPRCPRVGG